MDSICKNCRGGIRFNYTIQDEWTHWHGGRYCRTDSGFTATPLHVAEPVLETQTL